MSDPGSDIQALLEAAPVEPAHDQIGPVRFAPEVVERDDVRVLELGHGAGLRLEPADELGPVGELTLDGLDRDLAVECGLQPAVHLCKGTHPDQLADLVSGDGVDVAVDVEPKHPTVPVAPGRPERVEFEYCRHGTASIIAALDVHSGEVLAEDIPRNNSEHFIDFLEDIDRVVDPALSVHLVLDKGSSHVSKATKAWLGDHPRFVAHYTPKHASWLNQVELFFSILTRRLLKRGEFESRDDLVANIMGFIADYDTTAKPFRWTYDGTPLKAA
jgi:transposase